MNETQQKITPRLLQLFNGFFERIVTPMFEKTIQYLPKGLVARNVLLFSVLSLLFIGTMVIMSASMAVSDSKGFETYKFVKSQLLFVCLALGLILSVRYYLRPILLFNNNIVILMILTVVLLIVVLFTGGDINGATRWINLGVINFQPSELAKFTVAVFVSDYVVRRASEIRETVKTLRRLIIPLGLIIGLIFFEKDLGATAVVTATCLMLFFLAGLPLRHFLALLAIVIVCGIGFILYEPYRLVRLLSFSNPFEDSVGSGMQLSQSLIAFGRGEWTGVGLGNSLQKLAYLPEAHTDFLLAIAAEELGLIGVWIILFLSFALVASCMRIGHNALVNKYMRLGYLCYGIATIFLLQIFVNAGMSMGLLPTKGLTLPFMSYGGSSLMMCSIMVGVVWRTDAEVRNHTNNEML